ncbi:MAG: multidrug efflux SMR transporter [Deltaproteobacteria bacterium]|nr:multidrug efflux SMR transporter [Deltaproteobacteria bacterium]
MAWLYLLAAGALEIAWPIGFKYSDGFTKILPTIPTMLALLLSFLLMSLAAKTLPIGTVYAVWTGIGVLGTTLCGILLFQENYDFLRLSFIMLIFVGIVGLKFTTR